MSLKDYASLAYIKTSLSIPTANEPPYEVYWTNLNYIQAHQNSLTKTANGWTGNASSINKLKAGQDGWLEFEAVQPNYSMMLGLAQYDYDNSFGNLDYAIYLRNDAVVQARENGYPQGDYGTYQAGDVFRVERIGTTVYYKKNGQVFYEASAPSTTDLIADVSFNTNGGSIANLKVSFDIAKPDEKAINIKRSFDYDHAGRLLDTWHEIIEPVNWQGFIGLEKNENNEIVHTGVEGYPNSGAYGKQVIKKEANGSFEVELQNYYRVLIGLNDDPVNPGRLDMDYALYLANNRKVYVYENGYQQPDANNLVIQDIGDKFSLVKKGNQIQYQKNGVTFYTSLIPVTRDLFPDVTTYYTGDKITGAKVSSNGNTLLAHNEYNELGELIDKKLYSEDEGSNYLQSVDYRYNIRGWLTRINEADLSDGEGDLFGMELGYNEDIGLGIPSADLQYNGNISAVKWSKDMGGSTMGYGYAYDPMNRISKAQSYNTTPNAFNLDAIGYDLNGNIASLTRMNGTGLAMDLLDYDYGLGNSKSNQLLGVADNAASGAKDEGFKDGNASGNDYLYDPNGNMTRDLNKGIVNIDYNYLNLPEEVEKDDGQRIRYEYDAAGIKLSQKVEKGENIYTSDFSSGNDVWGRTRLYANRADGIGGQDEVLKLTAQNNSNAHCIQQLLGIQNTTVRLKFYVYIPSSNTNVDGLLVTLGPQSEYVSPALDQWVTIDRTAFSPNNLVRIYEAAAGNYNFAGAGGDDDIIYIKNVSITRYKGKATDYDGEFIYETDTEGIQNLSLIQHEEGRIVPDAINGGWEYQYYLKDHLGNNRVLFTTKPKTHEFTLNYESDPNLPDDEALFDNLDNIIDADIHDHTDAGSTYTKSQLLNGASGGVVGSVLTIPVGPGDKIDASVYAKYLAPTGTSNPTAAVGNLVLAAITGSTGTANYEGAINSSFGNEGSMITNLFSGDVSSTEPMAFINLMFLPEEVGTSIDANHFAFAQVSSTSSNNHALLELPETFEAPSAGYVVVYLSNESNTLSEVYFDDLQVTVRESPVIQTQDFYPFGLSFHNFNRVTVRPNRRKFNGVEQVKDLGLDWYQTLFRLYDPAIGRFHQIDPMADFIPGITPYQFGFNNPIYFNDPDGLLFGLGRTKEERQARRRQRRLRRESRRRQRRQRRKDWHPNYNPGNPKRGNTPVGPTLATVKPSYEIGEPENNTQIVGVVIPEPPRPRPPKPEPTPPVVATTPDPVSNRGGREAGQQRTFGSDPFVIRTNKWMNREVTRKFLQPYVQDANNNTEALMRIVVNVNTGGNPNAPIKENWIGQTTYNATELISDRKAAMEKMLIELGLSNSNQIQVITGGAFNTKEITIKVIR